MAKPIIITAVEYNSWISIMQHITDKIPILAPTFGLDTPQIHVLPSYPRDLTKFKKPSIIVQKVHSYKHRLCMGNFVGQYHDSVDNAYYDINGRIYDIQYQINVDANNNRQMALISEMVLDIISENVELKDYANDMGNPSLLGEMVVDKDNAIGYDGSNDNKDYIAYIRQNFQIIQTSIGGYPTVDLTKPIKFKQTIKL